MGNMDFFVEFLQDACPWMVMGLLLAVFFEINASRKWDKETYEHGGMGMCLGVAVSVALGINLGVGILAGLVLATYLSSKKEKITKNSNEDETI